MQNILGMHPILVNAKNSFLERDRQEKKWNNHEGQNEIRLMESDYTDEVARHFCLLLSTVKDYRAN